jgi:hypothetical protein
VGAGAVDIAGKVNKLLRVVVLQIGQQIHFLGFNNAFGVNIWHNATSFEMTKAASIFINAAPAVFVLFG